MVGQASVLLAFTTPLLVASPSQNSQQDPPSSGILQAPEPALPLALSHSVTCYTVSSGGEPQDKEQEVAHSDQQPWLWAFQIPAGIQGVAFPLWIICTDWVTFYASVSSSVKWR